MNCLAYCISFLLAPFTAPRLLVEMTYGVKKIRVIRVIKILLLFNSMSDHIYNYRDTHLSLYQVNSNYHLLLQIFPASFSYAITYQNKLLAWARDCDLKVLDDPGDDHELLTFNYTKVAVGLQPSGFTLVPNALFSEEKVADFARFLDVKPGEKVFAQRLDADNCIIYKVDEKVAATAQIYGLQNAVFVNKGWINTITSSNPPEHNLYLNIDKTTVDILHFVNGKVRFYNSFEFTNPDELAYYAAFVAQELQLTPRDLNLVVSGDINIDDKNGLRLAEFFNGVEQNELPVLSFPAEVFPHQLLSLAALSLCVSSEEY